MVFQQDIFFPKLVDFEHRVAFQNIKHAWDPLKILRDFISNEIAKSELLDSLEGIPALKIDLSGPETIVIVTERVSIKNPIVSPTLKIQIGGGSTIEPTTIIKGPTIIGKNNDIRQGAYLRGNVIVGDNCVIGHCTEVKNSILMNHVEAGHFNYIGDSILGSYVNMGAGSRLANVQFRNLQEKMEDFINEIQIPLENELVSTGLSKFGAIVGDNSEIGCNTVVCPGALIGKDNWIYPNCTIPKGFHPPGHFIAPMNHKIISRPK